MVGSLHEDDVILGEGRNSLHGDNVKDADEEMAVELRDMPEDEEDEIRDKTIMFCKGLLGELNVHVIGDLEKLPPHIFEGLQCIMEKNNKRSYRVKRQIEISNTEYRRGQ